MLDINGNDAFQKAFIFEESETLPGVETFGGIRKQHGIINKHFPNSVRKYMNSQ